MRTFTKGNVIVEDIKVGDIHYEFDYNLAVKVEVLTLPKQDKDGLWEWKSKNVKSGKIVDYAVNGKYSHYGPNLYDYEAYAGCRFI